MINKQSDESIPSATYFKMLIDSTPIPKINACQDFNIRVSGCITEYGKRRNRSMPEDMQYERAQYIITVVCDKFQLPKFMVMNEKTRREKIVLCRKLAIYFIHEHTTLTLKQIAFCMKGINAKQQDHTTMIHAINTCKDLADSRYSKFNFYAIYLLLCQIFDSEWNAAQAQKELSF
ncbi:MAG TPA: helix-turn-helix domain-containing protein [Chitinophagales bacterium]|nr:helix-turn-helix domain-containing protein [Cyclobacteriaceae bacterium]HNI54767.1 helix-turn-helix domain-containing protein [Chitinophagales bacterium]